MKWDRKKKKAPSFRAASTQHGFAESQIINNSFPLLTPILRAACGAVAAATVHRKRLVTGSGMTAGFHCHFRPASSLRTSSHGANNFSALRHLESLYSNSSRNSSTFFFWPTYLIPRSSVGLSIHWLGKFFLFFFHCHSCTTATIRASLLTYNDQFTSIVLASLQFILPLKRCSSLTLSLLDRQNFI